MKRVLLLATTVLVLIGLLVVPACNGNGVAKFNLTMQVDPATSGTTSPAIGTHSVDEGSTVNIVANPATGWEFVEWTSEPAVTFANSTSRTTSFTMPSSAVTVTANFEEGCPEGDILFADGKIRVGIAGELGHMTGQFQLLGANLAKGAIETAGGVVVDDQVLEIVLVPIETGEATVSPGGSAGYSAMLAKIDDVDFILGGFRTEAVLNYREVAMEAGVIFFNCGAATEELQHSVVTDYEDYKYWFKTTPYNEYFLAQTVVRSIDAVGRVIREGLAEDPDYTLRAVIVHDELAWAEELVVIIAQLLPGINVDLVAPAVPVDPLQTDPSAWIATLGALAALDPHFYIPVLSADAGVAFAGVRKAVHLDAMAVGINVPGQFKFPFAADLATPPPGGPLIRFDVLIDTWAEEVEITPMTLPFFNAFVGFAEDYPLYTAATYDALWGLKEAIEGTAWYCEDEDTVYADTYDIIAWFEDLENARLGTTGTAAFYPLPDAMSNGKPALSLAQVTALYPHIGEDGYPAYDAADWTMPAHTTHDIVYGPGYLTGLGAQWQWDAEDEVWKKYAVWPMEITGADLKDQYGDWNFEYTGTKPLFVFPGAVKP